MGAPTWEEWRERLVAHIESGEAKAADVAREVGIDAGGLSRILSGDVNMPRATTRNKIINYMMQTAAAAGRRNGSGVVRERGVAYGGESAAVAGSDRHMPDHIVDLGASYPEGEALKAAQELGLLLTREVVAGRLTRMEDVERLADTISKGFTPVGRAYMLGWIDNMRQQNAQDTNTD